MYYIVENDSIIGFRPRKCTINKTSNQFDHFDFERKVLLSISFPSKIQTNEKEKMDKMFFDV